MEFDDIVLNLWCFENGFLSLWIFWARRIRAQGTATSEEPLQRFGGGGKMSCMAPMRRELVCLKHF